MESEVPIIGEGTHLTFGTNRKESVMNTIIFQLIKHLNEHRRRQRERILFSRPRPCSCNT